MKFHGVGPFAAEALDVELVGALAYLLVGVEGYAHGAVFHLGMLLHVLHGAHNLGYAGLVVGAEQCRAVGHDEVLALVVEQLGELFGREHDAELVVEGDGAAVVVAHDAGLHMLVAHVGRRVEVGYETDCGHMVVGDVAGQRGHKVAVLVEGDVAEAHLLEFVAKMACEHHLARRGGCHIGEFVALRVELHIVEESVNKIHFVVLVFIG